MGKLRWWVVGLGSRQTAGLDRFVMEGGLLAFTDWK